MSVHRGVRIFLRLKHDDEPGFQEINYLNGRGEEHRTAISWTVHSSGWCMHRAFSMHSTEPKWTPVRTGRLTPITSRFYCTLSDTVPCQLVFSTKYQ